MKSNKQQIYSSALSVNPYRGDYYSGSRNTLSRVNSPSFSKSQNSIALLDTKSFISTLVSISKNIPETDLFDALENKVYEELALDMAIEYNIKYVEDIHKNVEGERFFHAFVVDPFTLEQEYAALVKSIKYVDFIIPTPLLLKSLYTKEHLKQNSIDCFIYFQENDSFFTIYDNGEFLYTKSLKYSLAHIHERFCDELGSQVDFDIFKNMLTQEGLNPSNEEYQKSIMKIFGEVFLHISDVITYAKRAYEVTFFNEIFIGSSVGNIYGLDEYAQTYLGLKTSVFNFNHGYDTKGLYVDQMHQLMQVYAELEPVDRYDCNFTIFHRPPPFAKRDSGKLILVTAASLAAALLYPGVYWGLSYAEEFHHTLLAQEYEKVHMEKLQRESTVNAKMANLHLAQELLDEQTREFKSKKDTLDQIHDKKVNYPMKAKILTDFTQNFNKYKTKLQSVEYSEDENSTKKMFKFGLVSSTTQDITELLKFLTSSKGGYYDFEMELISFDADNKSYLSELKALIRNTDKQEPTVINQKAVTP